MLSTEQVDQAAALLAHARRCRDRFDQLPANCRPADEAAAYAIQQRLHEHLETAGHGALAGHKIGCTTKVMQRYLKIPNPCAGGIFAATLAQPEGRFRHADFVRVGVECEIAVRLQAALPPLAGGHDPDSVAAAVDSCMAAIEIVDDRYLDFTQLDTPTLIADDFFNAGAVLGAAVPAWRRLDLATLTGRMTINGKAQGEGRGGDILGHPLAALAWLADSLNARGRQLEAGEIVLLGSIVQTRWLEPGADVLVEIEGLGRVRASFA